VVGIDLRVSPGSCQEVMDAFQKELAGDGVFDVAATRDVSFLALSFTLGVVKVFEVPLGLLQSMGRRSYSDLTSLDWGCRCS
jgi:hypothetical protein